MSSSRVVRELALRSCLFCKIEFNPGPGQNWVKNVKKPGKKPSKNHGSVYVPSTLVYTDQSWDVWVTFLHTILDDIAYQDGIKAFKGLNFISFRFSVSNFAIFHFMAEIMEILGAGQANSKGRGRKFIKLLCQGQNLQKSSNSYHFWGPFQAFWEGFSPFSEKTYSQGQNFNVMSSFGGSHDMLWKLVVLCLSSLNTKGGQWNFSICESNRNKSINLIDSMNTVLRLNSINIWLALISIQLV